MPESRGHPNPCLRTLMALPWMVLAVAGCKPRPTPPNVTPPQAAPAAQVPGDAPKASGAAEKPVP